MAGIIGPRKITKKSAAVGTLIIAPALGMLGFSILPIAAALGTSAEEDERARSKNKTKAQGKKKAIRKTRI